MGGNALKTTETCRLDREQYARVSQVIAGEFFWAGIDVHVVQSYRMKEDFGDLDIVVHWTSGGDNLRKFIEHVFKPNEIFSNGNVISFDYQKFQVDVIYFTDREIMKFAVGYFAWNDLGNFVGRVARRLNLKFGHDGLWYSLRDPENSSRLVTELLVTRNFTDALFLLGYNYHVWKQGFDTPEDIYQYVTTSEYFDPAVFVLNNRNYQARIRNRKRKMYSGLLDWLSEKYGITDETPLPDDTYQFKQLGVELAKEYNPEFAVEHDRLLLELEINKNYRAKINGTWARTFFQKDGKELGGIMTDINRYVDSFGLRRWIGETPSEVIYPLMKLLVNQGILGSGKEKQSEEA